MKKVFQALGVPANDDGSEFKREFKELMDFWDIEKQVTRGHAYFAERTIRTLKKAMLRRRAAGAGRRGQWRLMHATTQAAPNLAYSDPEKMAEIALRNIERRAKQGDPPGNQSRGYGSDRVKPIESSGRKRWCTGIFEKSPKTQLPNRGGWRCNPASGGCREAPGSHLPFDALCALSLQRLRQPTAPPATH